MKFPFLFGLIGLLTGILTLGVILPNNLVLYAPGYVFASGLGLGIWLAKRGTGERVPGLRVIRALLVVAFGYHLLVWLLLTVQGGTQFLVNFLAQPDAATSTIPIGYWLGLLHAGIAAAIILWFSLRLLLIKVKGIVLWWMIAASLVVCGLTIVMDNLIVYHYGFTLRSKQREWVNLFVLFLVGNTVMSFLYGIGFREVPKEGSEGFLPPR